jgi:hypothetical protein
MVAYFFVSYRSYPGHLGYQVFVDIYTHTTADVCFNSTFPRGNRISCAQYLRGMTTSYSDSDT